ncbi:hypothetical protein ACULNC_10865 [Shigella flexneri]
MSKSADYNALGITCALSCFPAPGLDSDAEKEMKADPVCER